MKYGKDVPIPERLQKNLMFRGVPVPYIAFVDKEGNPDFRVTDEAKRLWVIHEELCQLCGQKLGPYEFFVGGTKAAEANMYFEPACHLDCLMYAMQVCPFIAGKMEHADIGKIQAKFEKEIQVGRIAEGVTVKEDDTFSVVKNPYWVIKKSEGWKYAQSGDGTILLLPNALFQTAPLHAETMTAEEWSDVRKQLIQA